MESIYRWSVIQNIATLMITVIACKHIGVWGLAILLNLSSPKIQLKKE